MSLDVITVGDKETADINIIWFHGYGANNWGFEPFIKLLNLLLPFTPKSAPQYSHVSTKSVLIAPQLGHFLPMTY